MFVWSMRMSRIKLVLACVLVVVIALVSVTVLGNRDDGVQDTGGAVSQTAAQPGSKAATNEERIAFLKSFGWEVGAEPVEVQEVVIPESFDDVYEAYNAIQKKQGCDLEKYKPKRCKRYTYDVKNYPGQPENVRANLLLFEDKIIGGDISSTQLDGFMHGFKAEAQKTDAQPQESTAE